MLLQFLFKTSETAFLYHVMSASHSTLIVLFFSSFLPRSAWIYLQIAKQNSFLENRSFSLGEWTDCLCATTAIIFQGCSPLRSWGVQPICVSKGHVHLECCLHSGVPSFPRRHPLNSVTHTGSHTALSELQSAFQPTYNTGNVRNVFCSILKWETDGQKSSWIDFSSCTVTLIKVFGAHTVLLYFLPLFGRIVTEMILKLLLWRSHLQVIMMDRHSEYAGEWQSKTATVLLRPNSFIYRY